MAETTIDVKCPECKKPMSVPAKFAGKKLRCKGCEAVVPIPAAAVKETFGLAEEPKKPKSKPAPKPAPKPEVEDEENANPYGVTSDDQHIARCAFCAKPIEPPDARVCLHCGFDTQERKRHDSKNVFELTIGDYLSHHATTIGAVIFIGLMIAGVIICMMNMDEWFEGSFFEQDDKDITTGKKKYYVGPGFANLWITVIAIFLCWYAIKYIWRMLSKNWRPTETRTGN